VWLRVRSPFAGSCVDPSFTIIPYCLNFPVAFFAVAGSRLPVGPGFFRSVQAGSLEGESSLGLINLGAGFFARRWGGVQNPSFSNTSLKGNFIM